MYKNKCHYEWKIMMGYFGNANNLTISCNFIPDTRQQAKS